MLEWQHKCKIIVFLNVYVPVLIYWDIEMRMELNWTKRRRKPNIQWTVFYTENAIHFWLFKISSIFHVLFCEYDDDSTTQAIYCFTNYFCVLCILCVLYVKRIDLFSSMNTPELNLKITLNSFFSAFYSPFDETCSACFTQFTFCKLKKHKHTYTNQIILVWPV